MIKLLHMLAGAKLGLSLSNKKTRHSALAECHIFLKNLEKMLDKSQVKCYNKLTNQRHAAVVE